MSAATRGALERARDASGPVAARRLADDLMMRADDPDSTVEEQRDINAALGVLEDRYPDAMGYPGDAETYAQSRGGGKGSRGGRSHEGRRRPGAPKKSSNPPERKKVSTEGAKPKPGINPEARRKRSSRARSKPASTPRVDRAIRQTGIPAATGAGGSIVMATLGATVGMSLLYLLVTSAERPGSGAQALDQMVGKVTHGIGKFLSLEDVFPGTRLAEHPLQTPGAPAGATIGNPNAYDESPGSDVQIAASRLRRAQEQQRRRRRPQGRRR